MTEREMQIYHWCMWNYIVHEMKRGTFDLYDLKYEYIRAMEPAEDVAYNCYLCEYYGACYRCQLTKNGSLRCGVCNSLYDICYIYKDVDSAIKIRDIFGNASYRRNILYNFVVMDTLRRGILNGTITNTLDYIQKESELNNFLEGVYDYLLLETLEATDRYVLSFITARDMIVTDPQKAAEIIETAYAAVTLL